MLITLQNVSKFFGLKKIFSQINLEINESSISLLIGANGAGKSTLLRIMAGLANPSTGDVNCHIPEDKLGYLGHATFLYSGLSARENLQFWSKLYGISCDLETVDSILERVELLPFAMEKAGSFSRGMSQRLNLARILILKPKLWLLDEPSTGLDVRSTTLLRREIINAKNDGAGIVWISHDVHNDAELADRILALEKGKLVYAGDVLGYKEYLC